jgi:hypothetical protein
MAMVTSLGSIALGAVTVWLLLFDPIPSPEAGEAELITYELSPLQYADPIATTVTSIEPPRSTATTQRSGTITALNCELDGSWDSGQEIAALDKDSVLQKPQTG